MTCCPLSAYGERWPDDLVAKHHALIAASGSASIEDVIVGAALPSLRCWCHGPFRDHAWEPEGDCPPERVFLADTAR